jgi:hypothetical protein
MKMVVNNEDYKSLLKTKMKVNIEMKKMMKFNNFKAIKDLGVLTNA